MLVIAETATSTHHYHLREVGANGVKTGGGLSLLGSEGNALCGAALGWDTVFPLAAWNTKDGYSHWCRECQAAREKAGSRLAAFHAEDR